MSEMGRNARASGGSSDRAFWSGGGWEVKAGMLSKGTVWRCAGIGARPWGGPGRP
jgi:hypothetical protein